MEEEKDLTGYSLKRVAEDYYWFLRLNDKFPSIIIDSEDQLTYGPKFMLRMLIVSTVNGPILLENIVIALSQSSAGLSCIYKDRLVAIEIDYMKLHSQIDLMDPKNLPFEINSNGAVLFADVGFGYEGMISLVETCVDETMKASMRFYSGDVAIAA